MAVAPSPKFQSAVASPSAERKETAKGALPSVAPPTAQNPAVGSRSVLPLASSGVSDEAVPVIDGFLPAAMKMSRPPAVASLSQTTQFLTVTDPLR